MTAPHGHEAIVRAFGDPTARGFEAGEIVIFTLPYRLKYGPISMAKSRCHRRMVPIFQSTLAAIRDADLVEHAASYGGIYAPRLIRGGTQVSTHAWGIAIDLNPAQNPLGSEGKMDPRVIDIFKQHGFTWGGDFSSRKDPMHFQFASGY